MTQTIKQWLTFGCGIAAGAAIMGAVYLSKPDRPQPARSDAPVSAAAGHVAPSPAPATARAPVQFGAGEAKSIDLQAAPVTVQDVTEHLRVVATVVPDESRISHVHTRVAGWVEKLYVGNTGEFVRAGQPIVDIYSQELFASQVEYLAARAFTGPPTAVAASGRTRLLFFGMTEAEIGAIEKTGKPHRHVTLTAPRSGIIAHRGIAAGTAVDPSTELAIVLDLSRVWVSAEVPEAIAASIKKGMAAQLEFGADGNKRIAATVEFIDPLLTEATRTLKVRFSLPNQDGQLRPGMYGTAVFKAPPRRALTVPRDALVDTGGTQYVYVQKAPGAYEPRPVRIGARLKDSVEIVEGVGDGDLVAISGVFLLDSESRLRASGGQGGSHGGHGRPASEAAPAAPVHGAGGARHD